MFSLTAYFELNDKEADKILQCNGAVYVKMLVYNGEAYVSQFHHNGVEHNSHGGIILTLK